MGSKLFRLSGIPVLFRDAGQVDQRPGYLAWQLQFLTQRQTLPQERCSLPTIALHTCTKDPSPTQSLGPLAGTCVSGDSQDPSQPVLRLAQVAMGPPQPAERRCQPQAHLRMATG